MPIAYDPRTAHHKIWSHALVFDALIRCKQDPDGPQQNACCESVSLTRHDLPLGANIKVLRDIPPREFHHRILFAPALSQLESMHRTCKRSYLAKLHPWAAKLNTRRLAGITLGMEHVHEIFDMLKGEHDQHKSLVEKPAVP